ncbi:MAG TPA: amidohydrolase family protein [Puia sp.]|nr:amidohydrolase family protein [Puia sp.]
MRHFILAVLLSGIQSIACTQQKSMDFEKYDPISTLVVPEHKLTHAKFPFVDVHNHQWGGPSQDIAALARQMDALNMRTMINLSGRGYKSTNAVNGDFDINGHDYLVGYIENVKRTAPGRLMFFTNISFVGFGDPGWSEKTLRDLESDVKAGACGLKIYKDLGLSFQDKKGKMIPIDDPALDPIWEKCGELKIPVLIHSADPKPFWSKEDEHNERWLEIATHPDRKRSNTDPAPWDTLINQQHRVFRKHPNTIFIAAHLGWYGNDLATLGKLLDELPNVYTEFGAVIAELGRQPRMARKFFEKYQDRILFGKDAWAPEEYATYFRVLETEDEYFPYHKKYHAFWRMYGLGLPDSILKKVYYKNALKIIPGIDKSGFPE